LGRGRKADDDDEEALQDQQRLDKWLWHARFQRSRESCAELVRSGHVRVNARRISQPGYAVKAGDVLTLALPGETVIVEVTAFAVRRGSASDVIGLYRRRDSVAPAQ
jgi:ribosome-associated heat shock protein Hsp15